MAGCFQSALRMLKLDGYGIWLAGGGKKVGALHCVLRANGCRRLQDVL